MKLVLIAVLIIFCLILGSKNDFDSQLQAVKFKNPRNDSGSLYFINMTTKSIYEAVKFDEEYRSWFIDNSVQKGSKVFSYLVSFVSKLSCQTYGFLAWKIGSQIHVYTINVQQNIKRTDFKYYQKFFIYQIFIFSDGGFIMMTSVDIMFLLLPYVIKVSL